MEQDIREDPQTLVDALGEQIEVEMQELHSEIFRIQKEYTSYKLQAEKKLSARTLSNAKLRSTLRKREADNKHIYERLLEVSKQNRIIAENNHKLYTAKEELDKKIWKLEQSKFDQEDKQFSDNQKLCYEKEAFSAEMGDLQNTITELTLAKDEIELHFNKKSTECEELAKNCAELQTNICELVKQNQQLQAGLDEREMELEKLKREFASLSDQLCVETSLNQQENAELSTKIITMERNQNTLQNRIAEEREQNENLQHRINNLRKEKCDLKHALQERSGSEELEQCKRFQEGLIKENTTEDGLPTLPYDEMSSLQDQTQTLFHMETSFVGESENLFQTEGVAEPSYSLRIIENQTKHTESNNNLIQEKKSVASRRRFEKVSKLLFGDHNCKRPRRSGRGNSRMNADDSDDAMENNGCQPKKQVVPAKEQPKITFFNTPVSEIHIVTLTDSEDE